MNTIALYQRLRSEDERNAARDALCTLADRHALLGFAQANFARECLESAGVPLTLNVKEACGMEREGDS